MLADRLRATAAQPAAREFQYVGSDTPARTSASTTIVVTKPTDVISGDLLVVYITNDSSRTVTVPSGWTSRYATSVLNVLTRIVDGSDGSTYTFTLSGTTATVAILVAFRNATFHLMGTLGTGGGNPSIAPSISPTVPAFILNYGYKTSGGGSSGTLPAGWFSLSESNATNLANTLFGRPYSSGATGDVSVTYGGGNRTSILAAISSTGPTGSMSARFVAVSHGTSPYVSAYPFLENFGFGTKYDAPSTLASGTGNGIAFSKSGAYLAMAHNGGVIAYPWTVAGFGTAYSAPGTPPVGTTYGVAFTDAEDAIITAHTTTPFISAYQWSSSGFGTRYSNPASLPGALSYGVDFNAAGTYVAVAGNFTGGMAIYPWTYASGFGTKVSPTGTILGLPNYTVSFSPSGAEVASSGNVTPYVAAYPWTGAFGTRYSDPTTIPTGSGNAVTFSPSGSLIAVSHSVTPFVSVYDWASGFATKYADPSSAANTGQGIAFSDTEKTIFLCGATPFIHAYKWSAGFVSKYANPASLPPATTTDIAFGRTILT